jgi:hypothetical protein
LQTVNFGHDTILAVFSAAIAKVGNDNKVLLTANQMRNKSEADSQYQVGEVSKLGVTFTTLGNCLYG